MFTLKRKNLKRKGCPQVSHYRNKYKKQFMLCGVVLLQIWILSTSAFAYIADQIVPKPQIVKEKEFEINLDNSWVIVSNTSQQEYNFSAQWLKQKIEDSQSVNLATVNFSNISTNKRIILGNPKQHDYLNSLLTEKNIGLPPVLGNEGYVLNIFNSPRQEIIIAANTPNGVFYGVQTLLQLINMKKVEGVSIVDYPDHHIRAVDEHYFRDSQMQGKPPRFTQEQKDSIDKLASLKINAISLYAGKDFCENSPDYIQAYREMAAYCGERFIDFIPGIGTLRSISWVPFDLIEGWWVKDEKFKFNQADLAVAEKPFVDLLQNGGFETDEDNDQKPDGWTVTGQAEIDSHELYQGRNSLKIITGKAFLELNVEPNSFYHLSAYAKGFAPVISLTALHFSGESLSLYGQSDYVDKDIHEWRKFGVVLKTNDQTSKLRINLCGKYGSVWIDEVKLYRINGALQNVIRTSTTDIKITGLDKTITYQEGVDYKIINGKTSKKYHDELQPFQIQRLNEGNISAGQEVLLSYDCVLYWSRSHWYNQPPCVSDDRLYTDYYYPAIDRVIKSLHPEIINFSSCEIRGFNRDSRNKKRGLSNARLFAEWLNRINRYVKSKDPHCRIMIWDDMVSPYHNGRAEDGQLKYGGSSGRMAEAVEQDMIDKDVIMNIWWYSNRYLSAMVAATSFFSSRGFNYFGAPWDDVENIQSWSELLFKQPQALGGFATNWRRSNSPAFCNNFPAFSDHFWNVGSEIVYFSSFEKDLDANGVPDGWYYAGDKQNTKENLVENLSFENGLSDWKIYTGEVSIDSKVYHEGQKSVHFYSMSSKDSSIKGDFIPIEPDTDYVLSARAKANNIVIGTTGWHKLFMVARFYDYNKTQIKNIYPDLGMDAGTYDWTLFKTTYHSPNNAAYFRISRLGLIGTGTGEGWIDDIRFSKYEPPAYSIEGRDMQGATAFSRCAVTVKGVSNIIHSDFIPVKPNRKYLLSAYIKRHKINGKEAPCFKIVWYNLDQQYLSEATKVFENVSAEYKRFEMEAVSSQNAFYAKIYLQGQEGGDEYFWFDTVCLRVSKKLKEVYDGYKTMMPPKMFRME